MEEKLSPAKLARGKKYKEAKERAAYRMTINQATQKDVDWYDTQPAIVDDIKYYEDSLKPEPKETKSKKGK